MLQAPVSWHSILAPTWPENVFRGREDDASDQRAADVPAARAPGCGHRRRRRPSTRTLQPSAGRGAALGWPINGGSWTTFRGRPVELVADLEALTRARRGRGAHACWTRSRGTSRARCSCRRTAPSTACSSTSIPGTPGYAQAATTPVADRVRGLYRLLDEELASLLERVDDDDLVIFMSDHGHHPCTRAVSMNKVLEHLGFCALRPAPGS